MAKKKYSSGRPKLSDDKKLKQVSLNLSKKEISSIERIQKLTNESTRSVELRKAIQDHILKYGISLSGEGE